MALKDKHARKPADGAASDTSVKDPRHVGGDHIRRAQQWGGGSKASKGPVTEDDRHNQNSSAKT